MQRISFFGPLVAFLVLTCSVWATPYVLTPSATNLEASDIPGKHGMLTMRIGGGYALVFSNEHKSLTIASVGRARPATDEFHPEEHQLKLRLEPAKGELILNETTLPPTMIDEAKTQLGWNMTNYRVTISGSSATPALNSAKPDPHAPAIACPGPPPGEPAVINNLAFVPSMREIYADAASTSEPVKGWEREVSGRLDITDGSLNVVALAKGCLDFYRRRPLLDFDKNATPAHSQRLAHGVHGLEYTRPLDATQRVTFLFQDLTTHQIRKVVFRGNGEGVVLVLGTFVDSHRFFEDQSPQWHFEMFYRLSPLAVPPKDRRLPVWMGGDDVNATPREGCGNARFELP